MKQTIFMVLFILSLIATVLPPKRSFSLDEDLKRGKLDTKFITIDRCIEIAITNSPQLKEIGLEDDLQSQDVAFSKSYFLPQVDAFAGYSKFEYPMRVIQPHANNELGIFEKDIVETGFIFKFPIYHGGRYKADFSIAQLGHKRSLESFKISRQELIFNIYSVFYKLLQLNETKKAINASMEALQAHKKTTMVKLDVGRVSQLDVMKIELRLAQIEQQLSTIKSERISLFALLTQFMGLNISYDKEFDIIGDILVDAKNLPSLPNLADAIKRAKAQRPEIMAAHLDLERAGEVIKVAKAGLLPNVDVLATYTLRGALDYDSVNEDAWYLGVQANLPIYHGGAIRAKINQANLRQEQAKERLKSIYLQVESELQKILARLIDSIKRIEVTQKSIAVATETFRIETAKNEEGKSSINDLLDAHSALLTAEVAHYQSVVDYRIGAVEWKKVVGDELWGNLSTSNLGKK
ncbi:MAG: TolC family protein [Desulfamplus sp.]|nr:TolC family protein [Desulfamplus sp.]